MSDRNTVMTVKQMYDRLHLMEPEEKMSISVGEIRALMYYTSARAITAYSDKVSAHLSDQRKRAENCRYIHIARRIIGNNRYVYHSDYGMAAEYGEWPCTMELDD